MLSVEPGETLEQAVSKLLEQEKKIEDQKQQAMEKALAQMQPKAVSPPSGPVK